MKNILNDRSKLQKVYIDHDKVLNHLIHIENRVTNILKRLKTEKEISIEQYKGSSPSDSLNLNQDLELSIVSLKCTKLSQMDFHLLDLFYLPSIHQHTKFLIPMLEPLTANNYTIMDSFIFLEELQSFHSKLAMANFDIESLFTNIPLQKTIDLCVEHLIKNRNHVDNLSKDSFRELPNRTMSDGAEMGSPLGLTLCFCYHEKIWLQSCPSKVKPVIYRRYVDDTFIHSTRNFTSNNSENI